MYSQMLSDVSSILVANSLFSRERDKRGVTVIQIRSDISEKAHIKRH